MTDDPQAQAIRLAARRRCPMCKGQAMARTDENGDWLIEYHHADDCEAGDFFAEAEPAVEVELSSPAEVEDDWRRWNL